MTSRCTDCSALARGICGSLPAKELGDLSSLAHVRTLEAGQTLLWDGEDAAVVANIMSGVVKLAALSSEGREQIVGLCHPGDFIGRPFAGRPSYSAVALGPVRLCMFSRSEFERFLAEHPALRVYPYRSRLPPRLIRSHRNIMETGT